LKENIARVRSFIFIDVRSFRCTAAKDSILSGCYAMPTGDYFHFSGSAWPWKWR